MPTVVSGIFKYYVRGLRKVVNFEKAKPIKTADGKWLSPKMSRLEVARIKKECIANGNEWPFDTPTNNRPVVFKGQKHLQRQAKRHANIENKMKEMPEKIAEYYKNMRSKRVRLNDPLYLIQHGWGRMK